MQFEDYGNMHMELDLILNFKNSFIHLKEPRADLKKT